MVGDRLGLRSASVVSDLFFNLAGQKLATVHALTATLLTVQLFRLLAQISGGISSCANTRDFVSCSPEVLPRRYDNTRLRLGLLRSLTLAHCSAFAFSLTHRDAPVFSLAHYDAIILASP